MVKLYVVPESSFVRLVAWLVVRFVSFGDVKVLLSLIEYLT